VSPSNARIAVAALAGWQEDDLDTVVSLIAPEAELRPLRSQLEATEYVGPEGARAVAEDLRRDWAELTFDPDETHEDGETVVVIGRLRARARDSGAEVDTRVGWHWVVRDGRITFGEAHSDPSEAIRRAGLDGTTGRDVALVRRHYDAFNRDDVAGIVATLDPDVEILGSDERAGGTPERFRGHEQATTFFQGIKELVADNDVFVLSLDARPGRVEASVRLRGTLRASERTGSLPAIHFFTIRGGLITRIETYRPDWRSGA
jgi:ketosteroid isomerase-like protein